MSTPKSRVIEQQGRRYRNSSASWSSYADGHARGFAVCSTSSEIGASLGSTWCSGNRGLLSPYTAARPSTPGTFPIILTCCTFLINSLLASLLARSLGVALFTTPVACGGILGGVFIIFVLFPPRFRGLGRDATVELALLRTYLVHLHCPSPISEPAHAPPSPSS